VVGVGVDEEFVVGDVGVVYYDVMVDFGMFEFGDLV